MRRNTVRMLFSLAVCLTATLKLQVEVRSEGLLSLDAKAVAIAGQKQSEQKAVGVPPFSLEAAASDHETGSCIDPGSLGSPGSADGQAHAAVSSDHSGLRVELQATGFVFEGSGRGCGAASVSPISSTVQVSAWETGPVYESIGYMGLGQDFYLDPPPPVGPFAFAEGLIPDTASGQTQLLAKSYELQFQNPTFSDNGRKMVVYWSVGAPAGSQSAPFAPLNAEGPSQAFEQPTPGDAAAEGGVRFQAPSPNPQMAGGFDLEGAEYNPFTAFRFPEVPGGADHQFTLQFQDTWNSPPRVITGQAGETVDLRQYAPNGLSTLSLRGDLTPFLSTADAPGAAIPLGGEPQLVFGLAFARPGIGSYTLRPVPEPASWALGALALALFPLVRRSGFGRTAI